MTTDPHAGGADSHASHDLLVIAAFASGDLAADERAPAEALLAACPECRALADDLVVVSRAVRSDLPVPRRTRDFRLSDEDARRLRGDSPIRRLLERLGSPGFAILQPLGGVAAALGVALIVVSGGVLPPGNPAAAPGNGGRDGDPQMLTTSSEAPTAPAPAPSAAAAESPPGGAESAGPEATNMTTSQGGRPGAAGGQPDATDDREAADLRSSAEEADPNVVTGISPAVLVGGALILTGAAVLALRWLGGRLRRLA